MRKPVFLPVILFSLLMLASVPATDYYWEDPQSLVPSESRFPSSASNGTVSLVLWQEIVSGSPDGGTMYLSAHVYDGRSWFLRRRFTGPVSYAGDIPSIASCAVDSQNTLLVSALFSSGDIRVFSSADFGSSWSESRVSSGGESLLSPVIFSLSDGGFLLLATRGSSDSFTMYVSRSSDGRQWTAFTEFPPVAGLRNAFLPAHAVSGNSDVIVFQAWHENEGRFSYQLYSTVSPDGGRSWSAARMVTSFDEPGISPSSAAARFTSWHNQRPKIGSISGSLALVWERARTSSQRYAIYYAPLGANGLLSGSPEQVSSGVGECYAPDIVNAEGAPVIVWFDNRKGVNRIYMAQKSGFLWTETELTRNSFDASFGRAIVAGGDLEIYWQQAQSRSANRVFRLSPDRSVKEPAIAASNFDAGKKSRNSAVRFSVRMPDDSSGIAGYSWAWSHETPPEVPLSLAHLPEDSRISAEADLDGSWFLGVRAADYAGNWSSPAYFEFVRDTTPPLPPVLENPALDESGFLVSNTSRLRWSPAESDDIAGYSWRFEYVASLDYLPVLERTARMLDPTAETVAQPVPASFDFQSAAAARLKIASPQPAVAGRTPEISFTNRDNGIYALSVSAIDSTGNVSAPVVRYFALNKYVAYTYITYIDSKVDDSGVISLSIIGRGFSDGGRLNEIFLDRDGTAPWDVSLSRSSGQFTVANDRLVSGITVSDLEEGRYRLVLNHPVRGLYVSKPLLSVTEFGTVKFGDYRHEFVPPWKIEPPASGFSPTSGILFLWSGIVFSVLILLFSFAGVSGTAREVFMIRREVQALVTGDSMPSERKKRSASLRKKGLGLRFKLAFFTGTLVISVVLIVSIPLGLQFSANQERTLAAGLESRVKVLLDSLSSGARAYLPSQNILELGFLPDQISALSEAKSATITGFSADSSMTGVDFVWATNDAEINSRIDTTALVLGKSRLERPENEEIRIKIEALDQEAAASVSEMSEGITTLTQEGIKLALNTDELSVQRRDEIQTITRQLEEKLNTELSRLSSSGTGSWPLYDTGKISREITDYVFYKPVLFRQGSDTHYVRGTVRVEISTRSLLETVDRDREVLVRTTAYIALVAVLIGIVGALLLASIIISPVRKLASHVAMIRDTEDKEELDGKDLKLRSRDEIGLLGEIINDMTHGLVKAAAASKDLTVGKEVQKMFIPLETDSNGRKLTCGSTVDEKAAFFGYYEGAKGVSGDYFDYIKLDARHYAIIKCDVAGKGVPAALIMVEVATLFLDYFKDWTYEKNGYRLGYIVSRINDLIESRGFKGRFAAFTLCIFDSYSGDVYFCNAGDNLVHVYQASARKMKTITLPESSAAGVFPSFMVDMKGGFQVSKVHLDHGDVLFLYTDGIEEAKRLFRTLDMKVYICAEPGLEKESPHGSHSVGQDNEELGPERVNSIIESVFARSVYILQKWHNPAEDEIFEFDFSMCEGTIEEAVLALVSVEKIFRMYRDPAAGEFDRVQVDRKVDLFLNRHFRQYSQWCSNRKDHPEYPEYLYYTHVKEDAQYDDLTLLTLKRL